VTAVPQLVAARLRDDGCWEIVVTRYGRFAGTAVAARGVDPRTVAESLLVTAETVEPGPGPTPAASAEETERVLRWLEQPDVRLVEGSWASPAYGAGGVRLWAEAADDARSGLGGLTSDRRDIRPVHQPAAAVSRIAG